MPIRDLGHDVGVILGIFVFCMNVPFFDPSLKLGQRWEIDTFVCET